MTRWAKISTAFLRNAKVLKCSKDAGLLFLAILLKNAEEDRDGLLSVHESDPNVLRQCFPSAWRMSRRRVESALSELQEVGILAAYEREPCNVPAQPGQRTGAMRAPCLQIAGWSDVWRPPVSDAERARKSRQRKRQRAGLSRRPRDRDTSTDGRTNERTESSDGSTWESGAPPEAGGVPPPPPRRPGTEFGDPGPDETVIDVLAAWQVVEDRRQVAALAHELERDGWGVAELGEIGEALQHTQGTRWRVALRTLLLDPGQRLATIRRLQALKQRAHDTGPPLPEMPEDDVL